jgi:hypothetical protein
MAGTNELDSFLRKFVILWQSGCDAKLNLESEAGNAYVTLRIGLGKVLPGHHHGHVVRHRGGGPARQRRRERRDLERRTAAAAEDAVEVAENAPTFKDAEEAKKVEAMTEKVITLSPNSPIPQLDGIVDEKENDEKAHFELKVEAHEKCTNYDVIEAIQENFFGALDQKKVDKTDPIRHLIIREEDKGLSKVQEKYKLIVRDNKVATDILGLWNEPYEFDDLAFKNAVYGVVKIKIKEVKRVR